jgi:hypothetical protein
MIDSNLTISAQPTTLIADSGELWVTSTCYPPSLISYQQLTLCTTESIEESADQEFLLYPNPAQDNITVISNFSENEMVELFNELGKKIDCPFITKGKEKTLNTESLTRGVYLIKISDHQQTVTRKFILN